ncbi:MAG: hypothetical protein RBT70_00825 [Alphaproteobacteria bacterium]|jgi:hypothetical protein|nr:hypothetical protein [Alphaproteobacteria bacterium]
MIRLKLKREPYWLDLGHGVRVHVRTATTALVMAARVTALKEAVADTDAGTRSAALIKKLAELAIIAWEGIGDSEDNPAEVTPEAVSALMDLWPIADAFERLYLGPTLILEQEKNG